MDNEKPRRIREPHRDRLQDKLNKTIPRDMQNHSMEIDGGKVTGHAVHIRCIANEDIRCGQLFFVDPATGKAALTKEKTR